MEIEPQIFGPGILRHMSAVELGLPGVEDDPDDALEAALIRRNVTKALLTLTPREERVLRLRLGFNCAEHTYEEVGQQFLVTRERIRQIEAKALRRLKHPSRSRLFGLAAKVWHVPARPTTAAVPVPPDPPESPPAEVLRKPARREYFGPPDPALYTVNIKGPKVVKVLDWVNDEVGQVHARFAYDGREWQGPAWAFTRVKSDQIATVNAAN